MRRLLLTTALLLPAAGGWMLHAGQVPRVPVPPPTFNPPRPVDPAQAAIDAAISGLADQIDRLPLGNRMTVAQYLETSHGRPFLHTTLRRADVIGQPRQLTPGVYQVRLDISGRTIADALSQIATTTVKSTKITPDFVARSARAWADRTFTAVGVGGTSFDVPVADPLPPAVLDAARASATSDLYARIGTVPVTSNSSTRDLLALPGVDPAIRAFIRQQPVRSVEARPAGAFRVFLTIDRDRFFETLRNSAVQGGSKLERGAWDAYREPLLSNVPDVLEGVALPDTTSRPLALPPFPTENAPAWFDAPLEAEGKAAFAGTRLATAARGEAAARDQIARQLQSLPLTPTLTVEGAAAGDPRYRAALDRAIARIRVFRVEYFSDQSASVKISTDPRALWQDLVAAQQATPRP